MDPRRDAFVIWLDAAEPTAPAEAIGAVAPTEPLRGRVEHVQSSARASFASLAELLVFLDGHRGRTETPEGEA